MTLRFQEGELLEWSPRLAAKMILRGATYGDRVIPRRTTIKNAYRAARRWWLWTTALPGDRFEQFQRDLLIEVAHGTPRNRTVRIVTGLLYAQHGEAAFLMAPAEPCTFNWLEVDPCRRRTNG